MSTGGRRTALFALFGATAIWGSTFFITRAGMLDLAAVLERETAPGSGAAAHAPALFLVLRFALASAASCFLPGALSGLRTRRAWIDISVVTAPFFVGFVVQSYGLVATSSTVAAFLTSAYVVIVPCIVIGARRQLPPLRLAAGVLLVAFGIGLLTVMSGAGPADVASGRGPGSGGFGSGEILNLIGAFAFAYQIYLIDSFGKRTPAAALTLGTMILTGLGSLGVLLVTPGGRASLDPGAIAAGVTSPTTAGALAFSGLAASVAAVYIMYRFQNAVSPSRAAIAYAAEPAWAAAFAAIFAGEKLGVAEVSGSFLIILGNVVAELRRPDT
jgi:drug/metabolite transporter (DMT)-like permease